MSFDLGLEAARRETTHDGVEQRSAKAAADAELRGSVDAAAQGAKQARDGLSQRLEQIEAAVGEHPAVPQAAKDIVEQLKLARSNLVGLSECAFR